MPNIDSTRARVQAVDELVGLLEAAWDGFSLLLVTCQECEKRPGGLFAAFAFASAAAAQGRLIVASAPSLPAGYRGVTGHQASVTADLEDVADGLASLADTLATRLSSAARQARDRGDRDACERAAAEAARVRELLARDG